MPLKGVHYRVVNRGGKAVRLAFRGNQVVEAKSVHTAKSPPKRIHERKPRTVE